MMRTPEPREPHGAVEAPGKPEAPAAGFDRRAFLRRAAIARGVTWTVPIVTSVGVSRAFATPAPPPCEGIAEALRWSRQVSWRARSTRWSAVGSRSHRLPSNHRERRVTTRSMTHEAA